MRAMRSAWLFLLVYEAGCYAPPEGACLGNPCAPSPDAAAVDATGATDGQLPPADGAGGADADGPADGQPPPADGAPLIVECGMWICGAGAGCCLTDVGGFWTAECNTGGCVGIVAYCDGPEECSAESVCCLDALDLWASCNARVSCPRPGQFEWLCHTDADCGGAPCVPHPNGVVKRCL